MRKYFLIGGSKMNYPLRWYPLKMLKNGTPIDGVIRLDGDKLIVDIADENGNVLPCGYIYGPEDLKNDKYDIDAVFIDETVKFLSKSEIIKVISDGNCNCKLIAIAVSGKNDWCYLTKIED